MKQIKTLLLLIVGATCYVSLIGQNDPGIFFQSGEVRSYDTYNPGALPEADLDASLFLGKKYMVVQYTAPLTDIDRQEMMQQQVELIFYIPFHAYLVQFPASVEPQLSGVVNWIPFKPEYKLSSSLAGGIYPSHALSDTGIRLKVFSYPGVTSTQLSDALDEAGISTTIIPGADYVEIDIPFADLIGLAEQPAVMYLEPIDAMPQSDGSRGRSMMQFNQVSPAPGEGLDGSGIVVALADDGGVNHRDFNGRIIDLTDEQGNTHGDMTLGILGGAGNIDPLAIGMAPGANLRLYKITGYPHIEYAPQNLANYGTVITSTSYSEGCGGRYDFKAAKIDAQIWDHNEITHVFSAGNSSNQNCSTKYGHVTTTDGARYGNITGGRKAGKNVLAVANLYYDGVLKTSSSRGPAMDGRIKPDLAAMGQGSYTTGPNNGYQTGGGTSAAAPGVAGGAAILYQAYRNLHADQNPSFALIKAAMLNTTQDLGRPGPDYEYGWGLLDIAKAVEVIQDGQHWTGAVAHDGVQEYQLVVPAGEKELRIMAAWIDRAAAPMSGVALVNDLDLEVVGPDGMVYLPFTLGIGNTAASITAPAVPGRDRRNPMEQVLLQNPTPGIYTIRLKGHLIPAETQTYELVYSYGQKDLELTYPNGNESLVSGEVEIIRWKAPAGDQPFTLEYSVNNGNNWQPIASNIAADKRHYDWEVPPAVSGSTLVRISRGAEADQSNSGFVILGVPDFQVSYSTSTTATVSWSPVLGALSYDVFLLGEKYMEVEGSSFGTSLEIPVELWETHWISVRAKTSSGKPGRRAIAKSYVHRPCEASLRVILQFDNYPHETSWEITNQEGDIVLSGGPYAGVLPNSTEVIETCLPYDCYTFTIKDAYNDGICCEHGFGSFSLYTDNSELLLNGGQFGTQSVNDFCLEAPGGADIEITVLNQRDVTCSGGNDGWLLVGAQGTSGPVSFNWSNGYIGQFASGLSAGQYTVTVTAANGSKAATLQVNEPSPLELSLQTVDINCAGTSTGAIYPTVNGGTPPYTYSWDTGSALSSLSGLESGTYSLVVTDDNGCSVSASANISLGTGLVTTFSSSNPDCANTANGTVIVNVQGGSGAYNYQWSSGHTGPIASGLAAGWYTLTVSDINGGCTSVKSVNLTAPPAITLSQTVIDAHCYDSNTGKIHVLPSGGVQPLSMQWQDGSTASTLSNLEAGTYQITVTDDIGCQETAVYTVGEPNDILISHTAQPITPSSYGSIGLYVNGGTAPYFYNWSDGSTTQTLYTYQEGTYAVTVTDAAGCEKIYQASILFEGNSYCESIGSNTNYEWIESVQLNAYTNQSGNDGGYGLFSNTGLIFSPGEIVSAVLTPGYAGPIFKENWHIWIDLNQDNDFYDPGELVFAPSPQNTTTSGSFTIPQSALSGFTRMRIIMKYGSSPTACGIFAYGETEDYEIYIDDSVNLTVNTNNGEAAKTTVSKSPVSVVGYSANGQGQFDLGDTVEDGDIVIFPNPASDKVFLRSTGNWSDDGLVYIYNQHGQKVHEIKSAALHSTDVVLSVADWPKGLYLLRWQTDQGLQSKKLVVQ